MVNDDQLRNGIGRSPLISWLEAPPSRVVRVRIRTKGPAKSRSRGVFRHDHKTPATTKLRKAVLRQGHTCVAVLLASYLLCSSGQLNSGWSGLFVLCFGIRVALCNRKSLSQKSTSCVFLVR